MNTLRFDPLANPGVQTSIVTNTEYTENKVITVIGDFLSSADGYLHVYRDFVAPSQLIVVLTQRAGNITEVCQLPMAATYIFKSVGFKGSVSGEFGGNSTVSTSSAGNPVALSNISVDFETIYGLSLAPDSIIGETTGESVDCINELAQETMFVYAAVNAIDTPDPVVIGVEQSSDEITWVPVTLTQVSGLPYDDINAPDIGAVVASFVRTSRHCRVTVAASEGTDVRFSAGFLRVPQ